MTLAFALRGSNGLVLGADSRMTGPGGSSDTSTKFLQVNHEIGILTYGLGDVGLPAIRSIVDAVNGQQNLVSDARIVYFSSIIEKTQEICRQQFNKISNIIKEKNLSFPEEMFRTGFILAGFDANESNQFKICHLVSPDFKIKEENDIIAAQWPISEFLSNHFYYPQMDVEQLKRLAVFMLIETEITSKTVGGQLKIATVTLENGFQMLNESDIQKLIHENQPRFAKYRQILFDNLII